MEIRSKEFKYKGITGRYVTATDLELFYETLSDEFHIHIEGYSVENRAIKSVRCGTGDLKIFMWSQMHGNESTTTKAVLDLLVFLDSGTERAKTFLKRFRIVILPMVNPDGAFAYTRLNANGVDLNRDAVALSQPESIVLRRVFDDIKPDFAFNLHDQRTIFGVGDTKKPATLSLLAPSYDEERGLNETREKAMKLIVAVKEVMNNFIPSCIARFNDEFNLNCIGDYFQYRGVPTVLIESGHAIADYEREYVRRVVFEALVVALKEFSSDGFMKYSVEEYYSIPENNKSYVDVVLKNVLDPFTGEFWAVSVMYHEVLCNNHILFLPIITEISKKESKFAHVCVNEELKFIEEVEVVERLIEKNALEIIDFGGLTVNHLLKKQ